MIPAFGSFAIALTSVLSAPGAWSELLLIAASGGVVGMGLSDITSGLTDRFSGGGGEGSPAGDDDFLGDAGDLGEGFGDDLGGDDFGNMDDWDDGDDFDDFGGGGGDLGEGGGGHADMEPRIEELENEVASISSTMGTVRSENEAIQESVEGIEDNIRKLLEIYEMVTRGVNPFVDEPQGGSAGGSFGLFDGSGDDDGFDDLDPDVADADPDSFFDDDFDDGGFEDDFDDDDFSEDAVEEDPFGGDDFEGGTPDDPDGGDGGGEGKTFDELKSEYQSGDADWEDAEDATDASEEPAEFDEVGSEPPVAEGALGGSDGGVEDREPAEPDASTDDVAADDAIEQSTPAEPAGGEGAGNEASAGGDARDGKPYLETLPSGYGVELLVIEWLSYLRSQSSTSEALRAIKYYETISWIGSPAANSLQRYLSGLTGEDVAPSSGGGTQLTIDHHTHSLHYIGKLAGTDVDVERLEWSGPARSRSRMERRGQRGIQR